MEFSFGILKPDCLSRGLAEKVLSIIQENGLRIIARKQLRLTEKEVSIIYSNCLTEKFWQGLLDSYMAGDSMIFIVQSSYGIDAIESLNDLVGDREPTEAKEYTIRRRFGKTVRYNVIHSTANEATFWREVGIFFSDDLVCSMLGVGHLD